MAMYKNTRVVGKGDQTLILSHGFGASQIIWDNMLSFLQERYQIVLFDWDFSNNSIDPSNFTFDTLSKALISLLDELEVKNSIFVGHSMSGMIGCIASIQRPDLFAHLVLIGSSPRYLNSEDYEGGFERDNVEAMLSSLTSDFFLWAKSFIRLVIGADDHVSIEKLSRSFYSMRPEVAHSLAATIFLKDNREILEKINISCTIIQNSNDFVVPVSVGRYMHSKIKGQTTLEIIEGDGHFPQMSAHNKLLVVFKRILSSKIMNKNTKLMI
ncbi:hypothetical protein LUZ60_008507 [Juncus effusus]|nr:hypothetical protein LUZ60_008507 [Juncus effusus]